MPLLAKFSRSQTPPVRDLSSPADNDRFRSSKPPTSGARATAQPTAFAPPPYIPSVPLGVGSQPRRSSKTASKFGLHQIPISSSRSRSAQPQVAPIPIQPEYPPNVRPNKPSEHPAVEVTPATGHSGLRNMFTRSQTPQPQRPQPVSSTSNNITSDIETGQLHSRSKREREAERPSRSGVGSGAGPSALPPRKDDIGSIPLQQGEQSSQTGVAGTNTPAPQRKRTGSAWGSYLMPTPKLPASGQPQPSERRERATPNSGTRSENHPQTIPLRSKPSSRDLQSLYERSKPSLSATIPQAQPVSLNIPGQPRHSSQAPGQQSQSQATSPAPASHVPKEVRETKALRTDRSVAEHPAHPTVVEVVSHQSSRTTMTSTYFTAKSSQAQPIPLASSPSHHKHSYTSPLHAFTEYTQSSPGGESLLTPSSLATSYPLPWESSAPLRQHPQLYDTSKPLPPIVQSPAPPPVSLPRAEPQLEKTTGNNGKALQGEKHLVKLNTQIKPPSPPATLNETSSSSGPSSHGSSPASSFHSVQPIVESGRPPASGGSPPVVTLDSSDKPSKSSGSRTSSSTSIVDQSLGGLAKSRVTTVSVSPLASTLVPEVSPARVSPVQSPASVTPLNDARESPKSRQLAPTPSVLPHSSDPAPALQTTSARVSPARLSSQVSLPVASVPSVPMPPSTAMSRPIVASPPPVASGLTRTRMPPTSTLTSPRPTLSLEPSSTPARVSPVQSSTAIPHPAIASPPVATSPLIASPATTSASAKARLYLSSASTLPMVIPTTSGPAPVPEPNLTRVSPIQSPTPVSPPKVMPSPVAMSPPVVSSPPPVISGLAKSSATTTFTSSQKSSPVTPGLPSVPEPASAHLSLALSPTTVSLMMRSPSAVSPSTFPLLPPMTDSRVIPETIDTFENALALVLPSIGRPSATVPPVDHLPNPPSPISTIPATYPVLSPDAGSLPQAESTRSPNAQEPEASAVHSFTPPTQLSDAPLAPRENLMQPPTKQKSLPSLPILSPRHTATTASSAIVPVTEDADPTSTMPELIELLAVTEGRVESPLVQAIKSNALETTAVVLPTSPTMVDQAPTHDTPLQSPRPSHYSQSDTPVGTVSRPSRISFSQPLVDSLFQVLSVGGVIGPAPSSTGDPDLAPKPMPIPTQSSPNESRSFPPPIPARSPERRPGVPSRPSSPVPPASPSLVHSPRPSYLQSPTSSRSPVHPPPTISRPMSPTPKNAAPTLVSRPSTPRAEAAPVPPSVSSPLRPPTPSLGQTNTPVSPVSPASPRPSSPKAVWSSSTPNLRENQPTLIRKELPGSLRFWRSSRSHSPAHLNFLSPPGIATVDPIRSPTPVSSRFYDQTFTSYSVPASARSSAQSLRDTLAVPPRDFKSSIEASPHASPRISAKFLASTIPLSKKASPLAFLNRRRHVRTLSSASMEAIGSQTQTVVGSVVDGFSTKGFSEFSPPPSPEPVESLVKNWFDGLAEVPQTLKIRKPGVTWEVDHTSSPVASMPVLMARDEWVPFPQLEN